MAFLVEGIVNRGAEGTELLQDLDPLTPLRLPLSSSEEWQAPIFGSTVQPGPCLLAIGGADLLQGGPATERHGSASGSRRGSCRLDKFSLTLAG